jgi:predicted nucleic acid-binding Zn ribbon protein
VSWGPQPLGDEVRRELERFGPAGAMGEIVAVWPDAVGAPIAKNAWPARVGRDGTLHVHASSSSWAFELTHCAGTIRERLAERLAAHCPTRLRFVVGPLPEQGAEAVEKHAQTVWEVRPEDRAEAARIAAGIQAPGLREAVAQAVAASLARAASSR